MPWAPGVLVPWTKVKHGPSFSMSEMGVKSLADGDVLRTEDGDATLRVLATPGHTVDHCCFVLEEEGTASVFSGDHVLGGSSGVFEDLHTYMHSLDLALAELPKGAGGRIYPGHGPMIHDGHQGVLDYIENRRSRERQVVSALEGQPWGLTPYGIVKVIYSQLSLTLTLAAASNVEKTLRKLEKEGRATAREFSPCPIVVGEVSIDCTFLKRWSLAPRQRPARDLP
eukprot:5754887-Prymnesium_polylepis.2